MHWRLLIACAGTVLTTGCASWGPEGGPGAWPASAGPTPTPAVSATPGPDGVQQVTLSVDDQLRFHPARVIAHVGPIRIMLRDVGTVSHALLLPGASIQEISGGTIGSVTLTFNQPGVYRFTCAYHSSDGMSGELDIR